MDLLNSLCRLCLDRAIDVTFYDTEDLIQDIGLILGIKIDLTENLPNGVCSQCLGVVNGAKKLRDLSTNNDNYLHNILLNKEKHMKSITNSPDGDGALVIDEDFHEDTNMEFSYNSVPNGEFSYSNVLTESPLSPNVENPKDVYRISIRNDLFSPGKSNDLQCEKAIETNIPVSDMRDQSSQINNVQFDESTIKPDVKKMVITVKPEEEIPRNCKVCGKSYSNRRHYYNHKRTHAKSYPCPIIECGKLFATKNDVEKHVRVHTGEKPYECHVCLKRFSQRCTLKSHLENIHSDIYDSKVRTRL